MAPASPVTSRNTLALVSFLFSLVFPFAIGLIFLSSRPGLSFLLNIAVPFQGVGLPCTIAAIVTGHMALSRSKAQRGFAIAGLVIGYLTVAFMVFVLFLFAAPYLFK